jgi:hypothetical protein
VLDYVLRRAITDDSLGFKYSDRKSSRYPAKYVTDLDFADDIGLFSDSIINIQGMINAVEREALKVGLKINTNKTEYMLIGRWENLSDIVLFTTTGSLRRVNDFKYLGSWLRDSTADFLARKALAWKACIRLVKIWKSDSITRKLKINLFKACVESVLFYNASTWTMTKGLERKIDGCYTKLLRYALNCHWTQKVRNDVLYGKDLRPASVRLKTRRLAFVGHCLRSSQSASQPVSDLVTFQLKCKKKRGNHKNFVKVLLQDTGFTGKNSGSEIKDLEECINNRNHWNSFLKSL